MGSSQKTEQPTYKRIKDARERGEILRSPDTNNFIVLMSFVIIVFFANKYIFLSIVEVFYKFFKISSEIKDLDLHSLYNKSYFYLLKITLPIFLFMFSLIVLYSFIQTKFNFAPKAIGINFKKINPINGIKKIFSGKAFIELFKSLIKIIFIFIILFQVFWDEKYRIINMSFMDKYELIKYTINLLFEVVKRIVIFLLFIAIIDYLWQKKEYISNLKMTRQELKEEIKQTEGDLKVKAKIKSLHRKRMKFNLKNSVKKATFVAVNPTHYAVAIQYKKGMKAPKLVAKGVDHIALKIKEIAKEFKIPILHSPEVARKIYYSTALGKYIPFSLFKAVAKLLVIVYRMEMNKNDKK